MHSQYMPKHQNKVGEGMKREEEEQEDELWWRQLTRDVIAAAADMRQPAQQGFPI